MGQAFFLFFIFENHFGKESKKKKKKDFVKTSFGSILLKNCFNDFEKIYLEFLRKIRPCLVRTLQQRGLLFKHLNR